MSENSLASSQAVKEGGEKKIYASSQDAALEDHLNGTAY